MQIDKLNITLENITALIKQKILTEQRQCQLHFYKIPVAMTVSILFQAKSLILMLKIELELDPFDISLLL